MDLTKFFADGYQVIPDVFDHAQVNRVRQWLEKETEVCLDALRRVLPPNHAPDLAQAISDLCANGGHRHVSDDLRNIVVGQFPLNVRLNESLQALLHSRRLHGLLQHVFPGEQLRTHMPPMARFVIPRNVVAGVPPHQDMTYSKWLSDFITGWVPLVAIDEQCGGVGIHHGTKDLPEQLQTLEGDMWLKALPESGRTRVHFHMEPGDLLIFRKEVIHQSMPNTSTRTRLSIDYRFFGDAATTCKHFLDMQTWKVVAPNTVAA